MLSINELNPHANPVIYIDEVNVGNTQSNILSVLSIPGLAEKIVPNLSLNQAAALACLSPELMDVIGRAFASTAPVFKAELSNAPTIIRARFQPVKLGNPDNVGELRKLIANQNNPVTLPARMANLPPTTPGTDVDGLRISTTSRSRNPFVRLRMGN